jgi:hypothetical protein
MVLLHLLLFYIRQINLSRILIRIDPLLFHLLRMDSRFTLAVFGSIDNSPSSFAHEYDSHCAQVSSFLSMPHSRIPQLLQWPKSLSEPERQPSQFMSAGLISAWNIFDHSEATLALAASSFCCVARYAGQPEHSIPHIPYIFSMMNLLYCWFSMQKLDPCNFIAQ